MSTSIARALVTIKHFKEKFQNDLHSLNFSGVFRNGVDIATGVEKTEFAGTVRKDLQSIKDKIEADFQLRCQVNKANHENTIEVDGKTMTINDALTYRMHVLPQLRLLLDKLQRDLSSARATYRSAENEYQKRLAAAEGEEELVKVIERKDKPEIFQIQSEIDDLKKRIDFFDLEFDALLTEKNPVIFIGN